VKYPGIVGFSQHFAVQFDPIKQQELVKSFNLYQKRFEPCTGNGEKHRSTKYNLKKSLKRMNNKTPNAARFITIDQKVELTFMLDIFEQLQMQHTQMQAQK